jgi:uncharacterized repeat protein (TIGR03803 family)
LEVLVKENHSAGKRLLLALAALALASSASAAPKFKVVHAFDSDKNDGAGLYGSLVFDSKGNLYGTTADGGTYGYGTVFELTPQVDGKWSEAIIHSFNCKDKEGCVPEDGLVFDPAGSLYGMTTTGGTEFGSVFELKPGSQGWNLSVLHDRGSRGANLILDQVGNLYGPIGGHGVNGLGAISELVRGEGWKENWLYSFCAQKDQKGLCLDGNGPFAGVTWGPARSLYGTTLYGGNSPYCGNTGCGVVYELKLEKSGSWRETVLHSFPAFQGDGSVLYDGVALDRSGNIYGATTQGGSTGCGVIFKLSRKANGKWDESLLHDFTKRAEGCGANPLAFDKHGNLWGTAQGGTGKQCADGCGVVFKLMPAKGKWKYSVVHDFTGSDGAVPAAAVIFDKHGNLYGTTELGGGGRSVGVVFEITP